MKTTIFWLRRDLRLEDNTALNQALQSGKPVLPLFIFDEHILQELPANDARVNFIHHILKNLQHQLQQKGSSLLCLKGQPLNIWTQLISRYTISHVYVNKDYEPYAKQRDHEVETLLRRHGIRYHACKDQVIFEENEILKSDATPYTVFTPYKKRWLQHFNPAMAQPVTIKATNQLLQANHPFPSLADIGFTPSAIKVKNYDLSQLDSYAATRNYPGLDTTSYLSPHLHFGTISIRQVMTQLQPHHHTFLGELIWREFFMQILHHFPHVITHNFKPAYNGIQWRNNEQEFRRWCQGQTGYPLVDAGMHQLNQTGYMHNRVRMVTASFLCKHLLINWQWGEAYFAQKLLDYELSSNNGNWQWAAGTGCDAAPYFRIFNPTQQLKKFDKELTYVKKWVPTYGTPHYPAPMVQHTFARTRALETYKKGLHNFS
ncbi:deoxyribodipyrimidine photo-lyase [Marinilabiliaceae bacterium JC017]|nr:deoxyribodipyrimidine photo-lyase [Marinilabiliaceae bacterium JC017]